MPCCATTQLRIATIGCLLLLPHAGVAAAEPAASKDALRATLKVRGDPRPVAGVPIVLELEFTNTGRSPLRYWPSIPEGYPDADGFIAIVASEGRLTEEMPLSNGWGPGNEGSSSIAPGQTIRFPAAMQGLRRGTYRLTVGGDGQAAIFGDDPGDGTRRWPAIKPAEPLMITVGADPVRRQRFEQDLLARVRADDPFAQHVASRFEVERVVEAMLADLAGDDPKAVGPAMSVLGIMRDKPAGVGAALRTAVGKQLASPAPDERLLGSLCDLAAEVRDDDAFQAVLAVSGHGPAGAARVRAADALGRFRQRAATEALRALLADSDRDVRVEAAKWLSFSLRPDGPDPAAIPVLVEALRNGWTSQRRSALRALQDQRLQEDPAAYDAIEVATRDRDEWVRENARQELTIAKALRDFRAKQAHRD